MSNDIRSVVLEIDDLCAHLLFQCQTRGSSDWLQGALGDAERRNSAYRKVTTQCSIQGLRLLANDDSVNFPFLALALDSEIRPFARLKQSECVSPGQARWIQVIYPAVAKPSCAEDISSRVRLL